MTNDDTHSPRRPHPIREVVMLSLACLSYSLLSYLAPVTKHAALAHAHDIARFEARVGLFMEPGVNRWLSAHPGLAQLASIQYAATFFLMTGAAMLILIGILILTGAWNHLMAWVQAALPVYELPI